MTIPELVPLTNGLSVPCGRQMLVCDRSRITEVGNHAIDLAFLVAGTDYVPRVRLLRERIERATSEEIARILRRLTQRAVGCCRLAEL